MGARELGRSLMGVGGAGAGGIVPALLVEPAAENIDAVKNNWWLLPLGAVVVGGLLMWKGNSEILKMAGAGMVGGGTCLGYRNYKAEAGNVYGTGAPVDVGNIYGLPRQNVAQLNAAGYQYPYSAQTYYPQTIDAVAS